MKRLQIALAALLLFAAACGSSSGELSLDGAESDPPAVDDADTSDSSGSDEAGDDEAGDNETGGDDDEFSLFDEGVLEGMTASGLSREAAECVLKALNDRDVNLLTLATDIENGDLPDDLFEATLACGDELDFSDLAGFDGTSAEAYGDDPELDALWDGCAAGGMEDCDELYWTSPIGSEYEAFGSSCGETNTATLGSCAGGTPTGAIDTYGDDPELDALWDACDAGDGPSCDELYWTSPIDSDYEAFGASCGGQFDDNTPGQCEEGVGVGDVEGGNYGDDPELDALWDACAGGDGAACDDLYFQSPFDSEYEAFGDTCGNRYPDGVFSCEAEIGAG